METKTETIEWYRTPIAPGELKRLYVRSDFLGGAQSFGYLGLVCFTATVSFYSFYHWHWWTTLALIFVHGTCCAFMINAVHETGHNTVFKTRWLNTAFVHIFAFLGLINHRMFETSHVRHHRSTLHPPDDLEVVVPIKTTLRDFLRSSFVNLWGPKYSFLFHLRVARGIFVGDWEQKLFPEANQDRRKWASDWAKTILIGHGVIIVVSLGLRLWIVPVLLTLSPFYGGWLFFLCNNTQHVGLQDNVTDFRLNTRTFNLNPICRFLYWHMNFHTEHHMYVGVPCYNLHRLHRLIAYDLPPTPNGLIDTWMQISSILKKQAVDPQYVHIAEIPQ